MNDQGIVAAGGKAMLESQRRANQTRKAAGPSIKLLSSNSVAPDPRVDANGRIVKARAYDLGSPPPPLPSDAVSRLVQRLDRDATLDFVLDRLGDSFRIKPVRPAIRRVLDWLGQFPGATWEERWLYSGADSAPRAWRSAVVGEDDNLQRKIGLAANALMAGRVLRPSYGWQLESRAGAHLPGKMLTVNDSAAAATLRALSAYRDALLRHQFDAEGCPSRVMILDRTPAGAAGRRTIAALRRRREDVRAATPRAPGVGADGCFGPFRG
jgi:hypothetical protein